MKKYKIVYWITTSLIFIFEGVMPALTSRSELAIHGITSLGYPLYFVYMLTVFKVLGSLAIMIPMVPKRIKEWAYFGLGLDVVCAFISLWVVTGWSSMLILPVVVMIILKASYLSWHKLQGQTLREIFR